MPTAPARRRFLKTGLAGALLLATAGAAWRLTRPSAAAGATALDDSARQVLAAIVPVLLAGVLRPGTADAADAVERTTAAVAGLPLPVQDEIRDLFALLALAPARRLLAGVPGGWAEASPEDVAAFLQSWRVHRVKLLQSAYQALHDLVLGPWYAHEASWAAIGYPGPIKELS